MPKNSSFCISSLNDAIDSIQNVLDGQLYIECLTDWLCKQYSNQESEREKEIINGALRLLGSYQDYKVMKNLKSTHDSLDQIVTRLKLEKLEDSL
jgi:hypothetical protein